MTGAPKRIWVDDERALGGEVHVWDDLQPAAQKYATEYVRADLHEALRARAEAAEAERGVLHVRVQHLADLLERWHTLARNCTISEGVCCCGDDMGTHSEPMMCGHCPVDHGQYIADQILEETVAALRNGEGG